MAGFQVTKNFYEAGLLFPMLGLAVLLFLPGIVSQLPNSFHSGARAMIGGLVLCAVISQSALIWRFQDNAATWRNDIASRASRQDSVRNVVERCGIANNSTTSRLILDELSYTVLWRTREPVLERYLLGWYGTGLDRNKLIRDRNISGIVAKCETIPFDYNENVIAKDGYCCVKLSK